MTQKQPIKFRNIIVASVIIVGVTAAWMLVMFGILKLFSAGYVVIAWLVFGGIAYLVLKRNQK